MLGEFQNNQISTENLPKISDVDYIDLHPSYKDLVWLQSFLFCIVCILLSTIPLIVNALEDSLFMSYNLCYAIIVFAVLLSIFKTVVDVLGISKKGYAVREHDLIYKSGLINRKITVVPYNRVQHVALSEGFLLRMFGLTKLEFYTAGGSFSDLKITGISKDEAERIKAFVVDIIDKKPIVDSESITVDDLKQENTADEL